jgi:hypothetical protein
MDWHWSNLRFPHLSDPFACRTTNRVASVNQSAVLRSKTHHAAHLRQPTTALRDGRLASDHRRPAWPPIHAPKPRVSTQTGLAHILVSLCQLGLSQDARVQRGSFQGACCASTGARWVSRRSTHFLFPNLPVKGVGRWVLNCGYQRSCLLYLLPSWRG